MSSIIDDTVVKYHEQRPSVLEQLKISNTQGDFSSVPEHPFLFHGPENEKFIPESRLSMIYGPGGLGKSYLALQIAVALTEEDQLLETFNPVDLINVINDLPRKIQSKVLYISMEDPESLIKWRIHRIKENRKYGENLHIWSPEGMPVDFLENLRKLQIEQKYRLIIIDPLISMIAGSGFNENDNADMQNLISDIRSIAKDFNVAILLIHHTNKESRKEGEFASGTALRGASAIGDGCRFMIGMDRKTKANGKGADSVKVESEEIYMNNTKNNFARRFREKVLTQNANGTLKLRMEENLYNNLHVSNANTLKGLL